MKNDDDWLDDESDEDFPDYGSYDEFDDDSNEVRPCPVCGREVYEDSLRCPACGNYITFATASPWSGRPLWWIALGLLGVVALVVALTFMF